MHAHVLGFRDIPKQIRYMILKAYTCNPTHSYIDRAYRVRAMRSLSLFGTVIWSRSRSLFKVVSCRVRPICAKSKKVRDRTWSKSPALLRYSYVPFFPLLVVRCLVCRCMCPWGSSTPTPSSLLSDPFVCACTPPHGPRGSKSHCIKFVME